MRPEDILKKKYPPVILIFGPAGTGKTGLISQMKNGYIFDFDRGMLTAATLDFDRGMLTAATLKDKFYEQRQKIEFDTYREENPKIPVQFDRAMRKLNELITAKNNGTLKYESVGADSLTGLAEIIKLKVMKDQTGNALAEPSRNHWGAMINYMRNFLVNLRALNILILITAHIQTIEDESGAVIDILPSSITKNHGIKEPPVKENQTT